MVSATESVFAPGTSSPQRCRRHPVVEREPDRRCALERYLHMLLGSNGSPLDPADFQGDSSLYLRFEIDQRCTSGLRFDSIEVDR